jgi:hypothetical protein
VTADGGEARQDAMARLCADIRRLQGRHGDTEPTALAFWTCGQMFEPQTVTFSDWHADSMTREGVDVAAVLVTSESVSLLTFTGLRHDHALPPTTEPGALQVLTRRLDQIQSLEVSLTELDPARAGWLDAHAVGVHFVDSASPLKLPFATMRRGRREYLSKLRSALRLQAPDLS